MKDSAVSPVVLFAPSRQRRLLDGLIARVADSRIEHERLLKAQASRHQNLEKQLADQLAHVRENCHQDRRSTLEQWDQAQENAIVAYEKATVQVRDHLRRIRTKYSRALNEQVEAINGKVEKRITAVNNQYAARKDAPKEQQQQDYQILDQVLAAGNEDLEWARALTIRRLDRLLDIEYPKDLYAEFQETKPESVSDAVDLIGRQNRRIKAATAEMQTGFASKVVDSFYLPAFVAVFIVIWSLAAIVMQPENLILWLIASVPAAGFVGFSIYLILLMPLKRMTRRLHPLTERIRKCAEDAVLTGKRLSKTQAEAASAELIEQRDSHIAEAKRWQTEQITQAETDIQAAKEKEQAQLEAELQTVDQQFREGFATLQTTMRTRADEIASSISQTLTQTDQQAGATRQQVLQQHQHTLESLAQRLEIGLRRGMSRIAASADAVNCRFPAWQEILSAKHSTYETIDFLPLGHLRLGSRLKERFDEALGYEHQEDAPEEADVLKRIDVPEKMPVAIHRRQHCGVIIEAPTDKYDEAIDISHQLLWRFLSSGVPGRTKVTLIDPNSRGQHFASFMALADHDPAIIQHRVWTTAEKISQRLQELAMHVEEVLQSSLRDRFQRIEDYNAVAGSLAQPYHAIAAVGFPDGLSRDAHHHLQSLIQAGVRCGVFVILVMQQGRDWPPDLPPLDSDKLLKLRYQRSKRDDEEDPGVDAWVFDSEGLEDWEFWPTPPPPAAIREQLVRRIGRDWLAASRVVVPLQTLLPDEKVPGPEQTGNTDHGIAITVGSQGAGRTRSLTLGEGVQQHVLIAGKTGSGKSTLLHSIITAGASQYRPDQLQFYLLDFKKGVEFKIYADKAMPHARVIGIESEREFGRSVLQRLDAELTTRGELFRQSSVQELGEFRSRNPDADMPRIILVVDEFQELFTRDDALANDCTALLDRLVRQGRSFGIHIILSSQSLAGANSLPRATLGQMAVRIAMQCSESDAALILADDNTAARLLSRPGEAIYNDASGLVEGNHPFQVAWLEPRDHEAMLGEIAARDESYREQMTPMIVFEGNRPSRFTAVLARQAIDAAESSDTLIGLLGEAVQLGPPTALRFQKDNGRNAMLVAPPQLRVGVVTSIIASILAHRRDCSLRIIDGSRADDGPSVTDWVRGELIVGIEDLPTIQTIRNRDAESAMLELAGLVRGRLATENGQTEEPAPAVDPTPPPFEGTFSLDKATAPESPVNRHADIPVYRAEDDSGEPILVIVDSLDRLRDLRQDESMDFSLDASSELTGSKAFQTVLRDGPSVGVFLIVTMSSAETFTRWLPRKSHRDLELRLLGPINAADSALLIDSPMASDLSPATMVLYDDADGRSVKFRLCDPPTREELESLLVTSDQPTA